MLDNLNFVRGRMLLVNRHVAIVLPLLALGCLSLCGCGTAAYGEKMDQRLAEIKRLAPFVSMYPKPTTDLPVNLHIPQVFTKSYNLLSMDDNNRAVDSSGKRIKTNRALPPFYERIEDYQVTFEAAFQQGQEKFLVFLYVWERERPAGSSPLLSEEDKKRLKFENVTVESRDGKSLNWIRAHVESTQQLWLAQSGGDTTKQMPGVFEVWYYEAPGWDVMLAWRMPEEAWKGKIGEEEVSKLPDLVARDIVLPPSRAPAEKPADTKPAAAKPADTGAK